MVRAPRRPAPHRSADLRLRPVSVRRRYGAPVSTASPVQTYAVCGPRHARGMPICAAVGRTGLGLDTGEMGHDSGRYLPRLLDRPRSMRLTRALLLVVVVTACGSGEESRAGGDTQWETFTIDIDGLAVGYPATWHRAAAPLAAALAGDQVEVLGLVTGELPEAERGCSPYPVGGDASVRCRGSRLDPQGLGVCGSVRRVG
jgi:hypothetical protein